jgi:GAF domain-containing protein
MAAQLQELIENLEQRVAERTHEYEEAIVRTQRAYAQLHEAHQKLEVTTYQAQRRAMQLETAAEISRAATSVLEPDELVLQAVDLIRDRFDLYYAGLFLLDESGHWAVLRAGTGEPGRQMLKAGHKLEVGGQSMVGWCTANAQARIALDVGEEAVRFDNPLLPETRSEMALPLISRGRVIGALDVQSVEALAFSDEDIAVLKTMADQIAVAIDNARLFTEAQARLEEVQAVHRSYLQASWDEFLPTRATTSYEHVQPDMTLLREAALPGIEHAMAQQRTMTLSGSGDDGGGETQTQSVLVAPITLRGQVIGALGLQEAEGTRQWTADEITLVEAVAEQMALAIENARLFEATQARARRERLIREITGKVQGSVDLDSILQTTVQELGKALGASQAVVRLGTEAELSLPHQVEERTVSTNRNDQGYSSDVSAEQKEM